MGSATACFGGSGASESSTSSESLEEAPGSSDNESSSDSESSEYDLFKDRYHITVRADEEVDFYYDFKDREVLSLEMRESILNAVIK